MNDGFEIFRQIDAWATAQDRSPAEVEIAALLYREFGFQPDAWMSYLSSQNPLTEEKKII